MNKIITIRLIALVFFLAFSSSIAWAEYKEPPEVCPQERKTARAPNDYFKKLNPLRGDPRNIKKGKVLAQIKAKPLACKHCHGMLGNGQGSMALNIKPKPRNFTCKQTMESISDGQLFWIIKNGSKGSAMPAYSYLSDKKIWQLIHYIRSLSKRDA
jgi:mono/diheme cytochrome c family protein